MKGRMFLLGMLILVALCVTVSGISMAEITGSPHDFQGRSWNPGGQVCNVCHTPHNAAVSTDNVAPLWNHAVTVATFTPYSSSTMNASVGTPSAASKACLSCHDGVTAYDSFGGATGTRYITGGDRIADLNNDHPVSFIYDSTLVTNDGGLNPTTAPVSSMVGKTIATGMLMGGRVECSSCHDVHANKGDAATADNLLLVENTGSALCLTCHSK